MAPAFDPNTHNQLSGLSKHIANVNRHFTDFDGTVSKMEGRIRSLKDRWARDSIEQRGKALRNILAVGAWVQTFQDKDLYCYCMDMVTLVMLCADPYETITEGMAMAAAAHNAEYNYLTEAYILLSYGLTYPKNLMKKYEKEKYAGTGGWHWCTTLSSFAAFKGMFNNGAKDTISSSLIEVSQMIQNAIDFAFPLSRHPLPHAIFTEQLLLARLQASTWINALEPLYEILSSAGMSTEDVWVQVLIFTKAVLDDIRTLCALTLDKKNTTGMIWGFFCTTKLLEEYQRLKFYQHPHVSNIRGDNSKITKNILLFLLIFLWEPKIYISIR